MPEWLLNIPAGFWAVLSEMAPYLLFGFFVAGLLSVLISPRLVERHLGGRGAWASVKAAAFGVPLPLCSCGVIPVSASLRRHGAGNGPTVSFLVSTPQTGVDSILVTYSLLGGVFALFRPLAAFLSGIFGGWIVSATEKPAAATDRPAEGCEEACCSSAHRHGRLYRIFHYGFVTLPQDIGRSLLIGVALAALITALVVEFEFSFATVVPRGPLQILVLMAAGIPVYVCATASVPLAYALIIAGVSPGAAFAFLMTGPATNAATIVTVLKVMGRKALIVYLGTMLAAAVGGGLLLDLLVTQPQVAAAHEHGWMLPGIVKWAAAGVLLVVLAVGAFRKALTPGEVLEDSTGETLEIRGMTCSHCEQAVRGALLECEGVQGAEVDRQRGVARVTGAGYDRGQMERAVEQLGYHVVNEASA